MEKTDNTDRMSTEDLWKMVAESKNIYEDWNEISPYMDSFSFHEYLFQLAEQRSLNAAQLGTMACSDAPFHIRYFRGNEYPKETLYCALR